MKLVDKRDNSTTTRATIEMPEGDYSGDLPNPNPRAPSSKPTSGIGPTILKDNCDILPFDHPIENAKAIAI